MVIHIIKSHLGIIGVRKDLNLKENNQYIISHEADREAIHEAGRKAIHEAIHEAGHIAGHDASHGAILVIRIIESYLGIIGVRNDLYLKENNLCIGSHVVNHLIHINHEAHLGIIRASVSANHKAHLGILRVSIITNHKAHLCILRVTSTNHKFHQGILRVYIILLRSSLQIFLQQNNYKFREN